MLTQEDMKTRFLPLIRDKGQCYEKFRAILARPAQAGEVIHTITRDGHETTNRAQAGDYVVQNQTGAREEYLLGAEKFQGRYQLIGPAEGAYASYQPTGKIMAIEFDPALAAQVSTAATFEFMASWEAPMTLRVHDYLVSPLDFRSVYRIARHEFFETYRLAATS